MRIYLAARYDTYPGLWRKRDHLIALGHEVTSRWIDGEHKTLPPEEQRKYGEYATEDWLDLMTSDCSIHFTEDPENPPLRSTGGRHVEFGIALMLHRSAEQGMVGWFGPKQHRIIVAGPRENVFHWVAEVEWYPTWDAAVAQLERESQGRRVGDAVDSSDPDPDASSTSPAYRRLTFDPRRPVIQVTPRRQGPLFLGGKRYRAMFFCDHGRWFYDTTSSDHPPRDVDQIVLRLAFYVLKSHLVSCDCFAPYYARFERGEPPYTYVRWELHD